MDNDTFMGWLRLYTKTHALKSPIKYEHTLRKKKIIPLPPGVLEDFIKRVTTAMEHTSQYLDKHGYCMPRPLWKYDAQDETTWVSSPKFAYGHLLK